MENSLKITVGIAAILFAATGFCLGQTESKSSGTSKKAKVVIVTGVPSKSTGASNKNDVLEVHDVVIREPKKDPVSLTRSIKAFYKSESKKSEYKISMTEDHNILKVTINSSFSEGVVVVEIIDPKGEKQGSFTLKRDEPIVNGDNTSSSEVVDGFITKLFRFPIKGEWIIRSLPTAATGNMEIDIRQSYTDSVPNK